MEGITDTGYSMQKTYSKKNDYNDFYVQNDTLPLADVFGNFRNKCIEYMNLILFIFYQKLNQHGKHV